MSCDTLNIFGFSFKRAKSYKIKKMKEKNFISFFLVFGICVGSWASVEMVGKAAGTFQNERGAESEQKEKRLNVFFVLCDFKKTRIF